MISHALHLNVLSCLAALSERATPECWRSTNRLAGPPDSGVHWEHLWKGKRKRGVGYGQDRVARLGRATVHLVGHSPRCRAAGLLYVASRQDDLADTDLEEQRTRYASTEETSVADSKG
jgi:hypothetical protein